MKTFKSRCHCGNIEVTFKTNKSSEEINVRACNCSFCQRHGARTISDPEGQVSLDIRSEAKLNKYRFGTKTTDFLICQECGVYVGAVMTDGDLSYMVNNLNTFEMSTLFSQKPIIMNYDNETEIERQSRRKAKWTPLIDFKIG